MVFLDIVSENIVGGDRNLSHPLSNVWLTHNYLI